MLSPGCPLWRWTESSWCQPRTVLVSTPWHTTCQGSRSFYWLFHLSHPYPLPVPSHLSPSRLLHPLQFILNSTLLGGSVSLLGRHYPVDCQARCFMVTKGDGLCPRCAPSSSKQEWVTSVVFFFLQGAMGEAALIV